MRLTLLDDHAHQEDSEGQHRQLEGMQVQVQREVIRPSNEDARRQDEESDLRGAAHGDAERELHLILGREDDRRRMLGRVAHDRDDDRAKEEVGDPKAIGRTADGIDQPLREEADADGNHGEPKDGARNAEHALLVVVLVVVVALLEDMLMRAQLCETRAGQASR